MKNTNRRCCVATLITNICVAFVVWLLGYNVLHDYFCMNDFRFARSYFYISNKTKIETILVSFGDMLGLRSQYLIKSIKHRTKCLQEEP